MDKNYYHKHPEQIETDIIDLTHDHRFLALMVYLDQQINIESYESGSQKVLENYGLIAHKAGRLNALIDFRDYLNAKSTDDNR
tara:strand:- start:34 stop:282 length:249 start_codon:yes stop_codon:yes gene_type:complete